MIRVAICDDHQIVRAGFKQIFSSSTDFEVVAEGANAMRGPERAMLMVTHYQRLLNYIKPDFVHVMIDGRIVKTGGPELALELEEVGYDPIEKSLASA